MPKVYILKKNHMHLKSLLYRERVNILLQPNILLSISGDSIINMHVIYSFHLINFFGANIVVQDLILYRIINLLVLQSLTNYMSTVSLNIVIGI